MFNLYLNDHNEQLFWYEFVSYEELYKAYVDCKKRKRITHNCEAFEIDEVKQLYKLYIDLNTMTYIIGRSTTFIYHEPLSNHYREIFAADFIDRIVQHLLINRMINIFEYDFIDHTFSCRKDKGTSFGIDTLYNDLKEYTNNFTEECLILGLDIKSFFASLNKNIIFDKLVTLLNDNKDKLTIYNKDHISNLDIIYTKWLIRIILYNDPRKNCIFKQPKRYWNAISKDKSAFHIASILYLAVGNITSQFFANSYLSDMDKTMIKRGPYGRYVDDTYNLIKTLIELNIVKNIMIEEAAKVGLNIHPNKIYIQNYKKGFKFVGKYIKEDRIYIINKTVGKFWKRVKYFYEEFENKQKITLQDLEYIVSCINSYLGLFKHYRTYNIRKKILSSQYMTAFGNYMYVNKKLDKVSIYEDYLPKRKKKHKSISQRKIYTKLPIINKNMH